jgi:hypothetical protein
VEPSRLAHYLGRPRDRALEGSLRYGSWEYPPEDAEDGCPAGWRMTPLVWGVLRHARRRIKDGGRVASPFFDQLDDDLLASAVLYYEAQEDAAMAHWEREHAEEMRARAKAR